MKFAKELESDLVPEWRAKYFDYKQGKKKIKAVSRAIRNAERSTYTPSLLHANRAATADSQRPLRPATLGRAATQVTNLPPNDAIARKDWVHGHNEEEPVSQFPQSNGAASSVPIPKRSHAGGGQDRGFDGDGKPTMTRYGSIVATPPSPSAEPLSRPATLNLPGPAIDVDSSQEILLSQEMSGPQTGPRQLTSDNAAGSGDGPRPRSAYEVGKTKHPAAGPLETSMNGLRRLGKMARRRTEHTTTGSNRPAISNFFSPSLSIKSRGNSDIPLEALQVIDARNAEFEIFLEQQLHKIESFYKQREEESTRRLQALKEQLHIMRNQHYEELQAEAAAHPNGHGHGHGQLGLQPNGDATNETEHAKRHKFSIANHLPALPKGREVMHHPIQAAKQVQFRKLPQPYYLSTPEYKPRDGANDYQRKRSIVEVPYTKAKRKLKAALLEFYRGLELLKAYALLNRTAFRKINKKYDKAVHARPPMKFMFERVNSAYFVTSNVIETYLASVEDLYARYFEKGSHKVAVNKLRQITRDQGNFAGSAFRSGLVGGLGLVFGFEGVVYAVEHLNNPNPVLHVHTSYLLQIYGGYFALLLLMLLFCVDCKIFKDSKVNYVFVFEFDSRHNIDWWQLSEIPCLCLFLLGFIMWMNFSQIGGPGMYIYYPIILICATFVLLFLPAPVLYHDSRKWFLIAMWRLFWAGLYPVEFRDFFLGDMFCSQAFAMGNIELFFCLYAHHWIDPPQCNSSHSRLLGFFTCLPGIWRFLQCLRRYRDTYQAFPHLANGGKYLCTILYYMFLSVYRIRNDTATKALFILFASVNSLYTILWDIVMDWSLFTLNMSPPLLREQRAYRSNWPYYVAMVLDPILRCNWIFYAAFPLDSQHSTLLSFVVAISEVCRRGMWTIFRVENEHCTNVRRFRASRDIPLPYKLEPAQFGDYQRKTGLAPEDLEDDEGSSGTPTPTPPTGAASPSAPRRTARTTSESRVPAAAGPVAVEAGTSQATGADLERAATRESAISSLRRRQTWMSEHAAGATGAGGASGPSGAASMRQRVGTILHLAHAQDFQRRRGSDDEEEDDAGADSEDDDNYHEDLMTTADDADLLGPRKPDSNNNSNSRTNGGASSARPKAAQGTSNDHDAAAADAADADAADEADEDEDDDDEDEDEDVYGDDDVVQSRIYRDRADRAGVA